MELIQKKCFKITIDEILNAFNIKADKNKDCIFYSSIRDELIIEVEEV